MKKIILASALFAALGLTMTSCLKDKGFENGEYGLNGVTDRPGVGFPEAAKAINPFSVNAISTSQTINAPLVNLLADKPAAQDVHVVLAYNNALVTAYNTANGTSLIIPTAAQYTISSLTITIPAGQRFASVPIVIPNASTLSLTNTYALGFKIVSVDGGYNIASNMQNVLVSISVKNAYDGIYSQVSGFVQRYSGPGAPVSDGLTGPLGPSLPDVYMFTSGPTAVDPHDGTGLGVGITWANGQGVAGIDGLKFTIDPGTNLVSPTSSTNATLVPFAGHPNTYDPALKRLSVSFRWVSTAPAFREYWNIFQYEGPR
jgi:hypothetical protein